MPVIPVEAGQSLRFKSHAGLQNELKATLKNRCIMKRQRQIKIQEKISFLEPRIKLRTLGLQKKFF